MKIVVVGAAGMTGRRVVENALLRGLEVTAVSRRPLTDDHPDGVLSHAMADVREPETLAAAFMGANAVISTIGPSRNLAPGDVMSVGTAHILSACDSAGVLRFVMQSGITLTDGADLSSADRLILRPLRFVYRRAIADKLLAEAAVRDSKVDWTIVRSAGLQDSAARGSYTAGPQARISLLRPLSAADCADCLVRAALGEAGWSRAIINLGA